MKWFLSILVVVLGGLSASGWYLYSGAYQEVIEAKEDWQAAKRVADSCRWDLIEQDLDTRTRVEYLLEKIEVQNNTIAEREAQIKELIK